MQEIPPIALQRAVEQLRQEQESFNQSQRQNWRWFILRLTMGYSSILVLVVILLLSGYVIINSATFPQWAVVSATSSLSIEAFGLVIGLWKFILNPNQMPKMTTVTKSVD